MSENYYAVIMAGGGGNTYITQIEMNPSYNHVQSEASVYYDVTAALAAARR